MSRIEQGVNPGEQSLTDRGNPIVTRDARGRFLWRLPGNTPEQNEQLGIANVQTLFLQKFPEFNELFPRGQEDGRITEEKREEAKRFILEKIRNVKDAKKMFATALQYRSAPYFKGAYTEILKISFREWGIIIGDKDRRSKPASWKKEELFLKAKEFLDREGKISYSLLQEKKESGLRAGIFKRYPGGMIQLRKDLGLEPLEKPKGYWISETIEQETKVFIQQEGNIGLLREKRNDLRVAINQTYPGGMRGMKEKLGITQKPESSISPDQANEELMRLLEPRGEGAT